MDDDILARRPPRDRDADRRDNRERDDKPSHRSADGRSRSRSAESSHDHTQDRRHASNTRPPEPPDARRPAPPEAARERRRRTDERQPFDDRDEEAAWEQWDEAPRPRQSRSGTERANTQWDPPSRTRSGRDEENQWRQMPRDPARGSHADATDGDVRQDRPATRGGAHTGAPSNRAQQEEFRSPIRGESRSTPQTGAPSRGAPRRTGSSSGFAREYDDEEDRVWSSWDDNEGHPRGASLGDGRASAQNRRHSAQPRGWDDGERRGAVRYDEDVDDLDQEYWELQQRRSRLPAHGRHSNSRRDDTFFGRWATTVTAAFRGVSAHEAPTTAETMVISTQQKKRRFQLPTSRRGRIISAVVIAALLVLSLNALGNGVLTIVQYERSLTEAKAALAQLNIAKASFKTLSADPFSATAISQATSSLQAAHDDFVQMNAALQGFPSGLTLTPIVGQKLAAAQHVAPIAVEATQVGVLLVNILGILSAHMKNPLSASGAGVSTADIATIDSDFAQVDGLFPTIVQQIQTLPSDAASLDSHLGPLLATVQQNMPKIIQGEQDAKAVIAALPLLLGVGKPTNYMLQVLDSTELRPGGGFIGNYGSLTLSGGRMPATNGIHIEDVDLLDNGEKYLHTVVIPIPPQYSWFTTGGVTSWSFRDSNLDANFPTSAQNGEQNYVKEGGDMPFQGVIAITPWLIQNALQLTGPITLTEYSPPEVVSASNLIDQIHAHQLSSGAGPDNQYDPACGSSYRKCFTAFLFKEFLSVAKQKMATNFSAFGKLLVNAFRSKDIQVYFNQPAVEAALIHNHLASTIEAPTQGDSQFIVDANIGANKANNQIKYSVQDQVTLDSSGTATHHLVMTYVWPDTQYNRDNLFPNPADTYFYQDYLRVYVPPSASLTAQSGWYAQPTTTAFGRKVFIGYLDFNIGETGTVSLTWTVPHAATHDASGWHYTDLVQKQSGVTKSYDVEVTLPACAHVFGALQGFITPTAHLASYKANLPSDESLAVNYTC